MSGESDLSRRKDGAVLGAVQPSQSLRSDEAFERLARENEALRQETKRLELALRQRDSQLGLMQGAMNHLGDAFYLSEADGRFLQVNDAACRMLGYSRERLHALKVSDLDPNLPESAWAAHVEAIRAAGALSFESQGTRHDGSLFPIEVNVSILSFEGVDYICALVRDTTEREQLAAQLRQAQKMEAIGTLASGIAHDFNNALMVIVGNLELIGKTLPAEHEALSQLSSIRSASERARGLVQQMMLVGRPRVNTRQPVDLAAVIRSAVALLRGAIPPSIEIFEDLGHDVPKVTGDPAQIHQVLVNLCTNAWQAYAGHTGQISIGLTYEATAAAGAQGSGRVVLRVSDAGQGMSSETLARAFDPFFTTKDLGQGTGLGLSVVHGIVRGHGGSIEVDSQPGKGTTFRIFLPVPAAGASTPHQTSESATLQRVETHKTRVLYVDDDPAVAAVVVGLLSMEGHQVSACHSAEAALADLEQRPDAYEVVLTDLNMPRMTGLELTAEITRRWPGIRVIVVSGLVDERVRTAAIAAGARAVLAKPWSRSELARAVVLA